MNDFLSGYNFARHSDVIFSETIPDNFTHKTYVTEYFELDDGDIIFCKTDNVLKLFKILENENDIKNIKLITHESDYEINERLFKLKPKCISKWYSINVNYRHKNLIPIPLGIANDYCNITLKIDDILKERQQTSQKLLYINHRIQTNFEKRVWIYEHFRDNVWCTIDEPNLSLLDYKDKLDKHKFILCPRGNGIDTHRLWESLYHGIIPIVENEIHYSCLDDLPVIIVNSFTEITEEFLIDKLNEFSKKQFNFEKLKISSWINLIKNNE
jgi:hypothetical protein